MANIGELLRQTRQQKGITLEQAEDQTKVRAKYLAALEDEDYDVIPGKAYVKGFLKIYAGYLGISIDEVVLDYKTSPESSAKTPGKTVKKPTEQRKYPGPGKLNHRKNSTKWQKYLLTGLLAVAAIATLILFNGNWNKERIAGGGEDGPSNIVEQNDNNNSSDQASPLPSEQPDSGNNQNNIGESVVPGENIADNEEVPVDGVQVVLKIKDQNSWVKVVADGRTIFEGTMLPGDQKAFDGQEEIRLVLGNAGAVEVTYNGQNLGALGPTGKVVRKDFTKSM